MAYTRPYLRLVMSGTLYGVEGFSYGVNLISAGGAAAPDEVPAPVLDAVTTFHRAVCGSPARLTLVKLNLIGTDGRYAGSDTVLADLSANAVTPPNTGASFPPQVATAVSLESGLRRGLAIRGRFFLPAPVYTAMADGRMHADSAGLIATAATTFLGALNGAVTGWRAGIVSNVGGGAQRPVQYVRVGRTFDTIRSRRTSLPEGHVEGTEVPGYDGSFAGSGGSF